MRNSYKLILVFCLATLIFEEVVAQPQPAAAPINRSRPIPRIDYAIPIPELGITLQGLNAESNKPYDGRPAVDVPFNQRRFFYLPLFLLKRTNGEVDVQYNPATET